MHAVSHEFSRNAQNYVKHNVIQNRVVSHLLSFVTEKPQKILDLGCGRGAVIESISWSFEHFVGVDFAPKMLELHPKADNIEAIYGDFNNQALFEELGLMEFDRIISASSLQWAKDIEKVFASLAAMQTPVALAIFSSNTFATLHKTAKLPSLLPSATKLETLQQKYFADASFEIQNYSLEFESVRELFGYIKKSGVSGSRKALSYKETKALMEAYPSKALEFEVVFIAHAV